MPSSSDSKRYKIVLSSGRELGPIDLERIRLLIQKKHIKGNEQVRLYPDGQWQEASDFPEISNLFVSQQEKPMVVLRAEREESPDNFVEVGDEATIVSGGEDLIEEEERTEQIISVPEDATRVELDRNPISLEKTVIIQNPSFKKNELDTQLGFNIFAKLKELFNKKNRIKTVLVILIVFLFVSELFDSSKKETVSQKIDSIKITLPSYSNEKPAPAQSQELYQKGMSDYLKDHVLGYYSAAQSFQRAITLDNTNAKAYAMLASSYINLVDSSIKDQSFFEIISKLIELARSKSPDLAETVIADVEFYGLINKNNAAIERIVEYTRTYRNFGAEMFYYLASVYFLKGDYTTAARYLAHYPEDKAFSPKVFYLRGLLNEAVGTTDDAIKEYEKALHVWPDHARSRLRIIFLLEKSGQIQKADNHIKALRKNLALLPPLDRAQAYYFESIFLDKSGDRTQALKVVRKSLEIDPNNSQYRLWFYTLQTKTGEASPEQVRGQARMYFFLSEGEKFFQKGEYQKAMDQLVEARRAVDTSPIPLVKLGDLFLYLNDINNAKLNYKKAVEIEPNSITFYSKYIRTLVDSFEWTEAKSAIEKISSNPKAQGSFESLWGDLYFKQGSYEEALTYYKKSMEYNRVDSQVYVQFGKTLAALKKHQEAPFYYSLALRFDPLNAEAVVLTAQAVAESESIEQGIRYLQEELKKTGGTRPELLVGLAELQFKKGDLRSAEGMINQALDLSPSYSKSWKLRAKILEEKDVKKSIEYYLSYINRTPSDADAYLSLYRLYAQELKYDQAFELLDKLYAMYPNYPEVHYRRGELYEKMGNFKNAVIEYEKELAIHATHVPTLIAVGRIYVRANELPRALERFQKAMEVAPQYSPARYELAYTNYLLKNYQGAIALYHTAIQFDPGNPIIYKRLGLAYRAVGDLGKMKEAFKKYLDLAPDAPDREEFEKYL